MNWWNQLWDKDKPNGKSHSVNALPILHELIERSEEEKEALQRWEEDGTRGEMFTFLRNQFSNWLTEKDTENIDFLYTPSFKGFVIHFKELPWDRSDCTCFFDTLKEKIRGIKYRTYVSDFKLFEKEHWTERVERHYLKPPPTFMQDGRYKQQFGNINIELRLRDEMPLQLKFSVAHFNDRQYTSAQTFEKLMEVVLG